MDPNLDPVELDDGNLVLSFDAAGRIVGFRSRATGTDFLTRPGIEDNWRLMVLEGGYAISYILGREQTPDSVERDGDRVRFRYDSLVHAGKTYPIGVEFSAWLADGEARFAVTVRNGHDRRVREVWYPILAGFEGWQGDDREHVVNFAKAGTLAPDILHRGLPQCEYLFCVEGETGRYHYPGEQMNFIDLYGEQSGLYVSSDDRGLTMSVIQLEKYPPEAGAGGENTYRERHIFPEGTPRWLTISTGKTTVIDPGESWEGAPAVFWPHSGDWHVAAKHYRTQVDRWMDWPAERPEWLRDYVGWQHLVGKTYLEEYYHTFDQFVEVMTESQARTGVDLLMLYGHTEHGCESANSDISPGASLGGPDGFRRMCDALHARGMRVAIMTHRQSAIATDDPAHPQFAAWTIKDREGVTRREVWYKTTIESQRMAMGNHYEATGPVWHRICPYCDAWWEGCRDQLLNLIDLGLDGAQLDTIGVEGSLCFAADHGHTPGEGQTAKLAERLAWLRREIRAVKPDFLMAGEELRDWQYQYLDLPYSRYRNDDGYQVFRYAFPETEENVAVGAYSYDQANKSFLLGLGMNVEVWGLKKSVLACPELADYIGGITRIRRSHADSLINGRFRDTIGATVDGDVRYGVHEGADGPIVVLWNSGDEAQRCQVSIDGVEHSTVLRPLETQEEVALPGVIEVGAHRALAIVPRG